MKRFATVLFMAILTGTLLTSCSQSAPPSEIPTQLQTSAPSSSPSDERVDPTPTVIPSKSLSETLESTSPSPKPIIYPDLSDLEFVNLTDMVFTFASGVGAWCTEIKILPDGTFSGYHSDQDMGDSSPGYPNGTRYYCSFSGKFSSLKKTNDYEYSMKCESITQEGIADEVKIGEDGWRYITSRPYGFDNADEFILYLPGKKIDELPEAFISWVRMPWNIDSKSIDVLPFYGLYNVEGEQGFSH